MCAVESILLLKARKRGVSIELYRQMKALAEALGTWAEIRPELLQLARQNRTTLAGIYLCEEDWDAALALARENAVYWLL